MANRYQSFSFTTASVASGVVLQASQVLGPHVYNLVKLKIVRNTGAGNINFRIFKKGVWGSTNRLARWENQAVPLLQPVDKTSGSPGIEALEGIAIPVDDEDGTNNDGAGKLHHELENLGTTSTFTISGEYEEVVVLSSAGDPSWRGAVSALTSVSLRGATSGTAIIAAPAVAGTPTLTLPTASGTFARLQDKLSAFAATTSAELAGVISDETGSGALVFATSPTLVTPTLDVATATRLGIGAAADATAPLNVVGTSASLGNIRSQSATDLANNFAQLQVRDNTAFTTGVGGVINFSGIYTSTTQIDFAAIQGFKENSTDGNYAGGLRFFTRANGSGGFSTQERMRITSAGNVGIGGTPSVNLHVFGAAATAQTSQFEAVTGQQSLINIGSTSGGYAQISVDSSGNLGLGHQGVATPYSSIRSGAVNNTLTLQLGSVVVGAAAIATNATNGFLYIPSCAGTPTGVPTTFTGRLAVVYDSTNNKLYAYNGAWKSVTLA